MLSAIDKVRIAVLASGGGTNLQALFDAEDNGILKSGSIELVISDKPDAYALKRAEKRGVKSVLIERKAFPSAAEFEAEIINTLKANDIELIILAGFMRILSPEFTRTFENRIINVHPSLIPSFCGKGYYGLKVHEAALDYGVKITGATVHFVNEIPDGGKIIKQKAVAVLEDDTPESLQKRVMQQAEWIILPEAAEEVSLNIINTRNDFLRKGN
ncbi:MAG: phosphoribosylglycinamide formyltransferase [Clostridiales bacterium]|jgi:phosphoribosylglycinamide formyltransferase-1|nr:phosphoribosylglycinamide formyltransferase [Clostridiales bacterium]